MDYDNDGWLDLIGYGNALRIWRNLGKAGFADVTARLGLDKAGPAEALVTTDFDNDGDTDVILATAGGLRFWRNDRGNANQQLKLRLLGNRSNASGLGVRVDLVAGRWRARRSLQQLPFEIGIGNRDKIDTLKIHWFDLATTAVDVMIQPQPLPVVELTVPAGSCPYVFTRGMERIFGSSPTFWEHHPWVCRSHKAVTSKPTPRSFSLWGMISRSRRATGGMKSESPRSCARCFIWTRRAWWWWIIRSARWFTPRVNCARASFFRGMSCGRCDRCDRSQTPFAAMA